MPIGYFPSRNRLGDYLASGISGFADRFRQAQEGVRERQLADQAQQNQQLSAELAHPGLHFGSRPVTPPGHVSINPSTQRPEFAENFRALSDNAYLDLGEQQREQERQQALAGNSAFAHAFQAARGAAEGDPTGPAYRTAETDHLRHPNPVAPVMGSPEWLQAQRELEGIRAAGRPAPSQFTFLPGTDTSGKPITVRGNTKTGEVTRSDIGRPATGQAGEREAAQLSVAQNQATEADRIMSAFEDEILNGKRNISTSGAAAAKMALGGGAILSSAAETALNKTDPGLMGYIRAAKALASAERLITPRGGSNALSHIEGVLAGAGPHANPDLIHQAREYRRALVGGLAGHGTPQTHQAPDSSHVWSKYGITPSVP